MATPRPIDRIIGPAMLLGNNVLDMERRSRRGEIGEVAVLTPATSPIANELAKRPRHQASAERLRMARALACKIAMKSIALT